MAVKEIVHWVDEVRGIPVTHVTRGAASKDSDRYYHNHRVALDELAIVVLKASDMLDPQDGKDNNVINVSEFDNNDRHCVIVSGLRGYVGFTYEVVHNCFNGELLAWAGFSMSSDSRAELLDAMIK